MSSHVRRRRGRKYCVVLNRRSHFVDPVASPLPLPLSHQYLQSKIQLTKFGLPVSSRLPCGRVLCHRRPCISPPKRCPRRNHDRLSLRYPRQIVTLLSHQPANESDDKAQCSLLHERSALPPLLVHSATLMSTPAPIKLIYHVTERPNLHPSLPFRPPLLATAAAKAVNHRRHRRLPGGTTIYPAHRVPRRPCRVPEVNWDVRHRGELLQALAIFLLTPRPVRLAHVQQAPSVHALLPELSLLQTEAYPRLLLLIYRSLLPVLLPLPDDPRSMLHVGLQLTRPEGRR